MEAQVKQTLKTTLRNWESILDRMTMKLSSLLSIKPESMMLNMIKKVDFIVKYQ